LVGWIFDPTDLTTAFAALTHGKITPLHNRITRYPRPDVLRSFGITANSPRQCGFIAIIETDAPTIVGTCRLQLGRGRQAPYIDVSVGDAMDDYPSFLQNLRTSFAPETRMSIFEEMESAGVFTELTPLQANNFIENWNIAVRECPTLINDPLASTELHIDTAQQLAECGILVIGWLHCSHATVKTVDFVRVDGLRHRVSEDWNRHERSDVARTLKEKGEFIETDEAGFLFIVKAPQQQERLSYLVVTWSDGRIQRIRVDVKSSPTDPIAVVMLTLNSLAPSSRYLLPMLTGHIGPAVSGVWQSRPTGKGEEVVLEFGTVPDRPEVSIIVPIYGRYDFIEHQLAQFVNDPAMRRNELLYVIDDPLIYDQVRLSCIEIARLYDFPFKVLYQKVNRGFSGANNFGAKHARGVKLLLLNSDVFPRRSGWLSALVEAYDALPDAGVIAPKLLFEDGSIQHAGIHFVRYPVWGGMWINDHPLKGQPDNPEEKGLVEFAAVTAACMLIDTELYRKVGGLSEDYIIGDFEDTDLCLRLRAAGRRNWLHHGVTLYHLERQSQAFTGNLTWRTNLTIYNCWVHYQRWDAIISQIVAEQRIPPKSG